MDATDWSGCDSGRSFAAIDFETATSQRSSACAVGVVVFEQGSPVDRRRLLIRPPGNRYDAFSLQYGSARNRPCGHRRQSPVLRGLGPGRRHGRRASCGCAQHGIRHVGSAEKREHYGYEPESFPFACTYRLARSAFPEARSWGLKGLAAEFGIPLSHHDPLSDAQAAGHLWLALPECFNTTYPELLALHGYRLGRCDLSAYRSYSNAQPSSRGASSSFSAKDFTPRAEPDPDGLLYATKIAFTGTLECTPRREAFQAAVDAGAAPTGSVSKRTDYLVVGTIDLRRVGETGLGSKHSTALDLVAEGSQIRIIDEDQFVCLLAGTITRDSPDQPVEDEIRHTTTTVRDRASWPRETRGTCVLDLRWQHRRGWLWGTCLDCAVGGLCGDGLLAG